MILDSDMDISPEQLSLLVQSTINKSKDFSYTNIHAPDWPVNTDLVTSIEICLISSIYLFNIFGYVISIYKPNEIFSISEMTEDEYVELTKLSKEWRKNEYKKCINTRR